MKLSGQILKRAILASSILIDIFYLFLNKSKICFVDVHVADIMDTWIHHGAQNVMGYFLAIYTRTNLF